MTGWTNEIGFYYDRYYLEPEYDEEYDEKELEDEENDD
jgi:hypothetical protein